MDTCEYCGEEIPEWQGLKNYCSEYCKVKDGAGERTIFD